MLSARRGPDRQAARPRAPRCALPPPPGPAASVRRHGAPPAIRQSRPASVQGATNSDSAQVVSAPSREVLGRLTAQDIMSSKLVRVTPEESAFTVMELLVENGVSGLPVVDSNNRVIGVVSAYDVLALDCTPGQLDKSEGFFPPINKCINEFGGDRNAMWRDFHERRAAIKKARATRVGDSMHETYTVPQTMSLPDVADFIVRKRLHRVFVVDALDKLVGVVSRGDIMRATIKSFRHVMDGPSH